MNIEYFEKVYLKSSELPDIINGWYYTDLGFLYFRKEAIKQEYLGWCENEIQPYNKRYPTFYFKSCSYKSSSKKETIAFVEWMDKSVLQMHSIHLKPWHYNGEGFTTEELYDKFKTL